MCCQMGWIGCPIFQVSQKPSWEFSYFHISGIPSSSRHEKCCQILQKLFGVFQYSRNSQFLSPQWAQIEFLYLFPILYYYFKHSKVPKKLEEKMLWNCTFQKKIQKFLNVTSEIILLCYACLLDTIQKFLCKLGIKPHMQL